MAKKENKYIGYLVLSAIPLIGIVWAMIAGGVHGSYVKKAQNEEKNFEVTFKETLNNILQTNENLVNVDGMTITEDINITSAKLNTFSAKLPNDPIPTLDAPTSYTVSLGANPKTLEDGSKGFDLIYEFFISRDDYSTLCNYYDNDAISILGYDEYIYQTYYKNNPRKSPIYYIKELFNKYKDDQNNLNYFEYKNVELYASGADMVVNLIDELMLDEITLESKDELDKIASVYALLSDADKEKVTNYDDYLVALDKWEVIEVNTLIAHQNAFTTKGLPLKENMGFGDKQTIDKVKAKYDALSDSQKEQVVGYDVLIDTIKYYDVVYVTYYVTKYQENKTENRLTNAVNRYNTMDKEYQGQISKEIMNALTKAVNEYNADENHPNKLTLETK